MVGRRTSPRCANCRQRKIKCDLLQPACSQCIRSRWQCPGYDMHSRFFVYEKGFSGTSTATSWSCSQPSLFDKQIAKNGTRAVHLLRMFPESEIDKLRTKFIFQSTQRTVAARFAVIGEDHLLSRIPKRVGHNQALDDAVKCICTTGSFQTTSDKQHILSAVAYSEALRSLQKMLNDSEKCSTSETLSAATLLQMYEHSVDNSELRWMVHANGVIKMLELRGPTHINNELDRSILRAQVGNIFFNSIRNQKECFLAEPQWLPVLEQSMSEAHQGGTSRDEGFAAMTLASLRIPGILCHYEQIGRRTPTSSIIEKRDASFRHAIDYVGLVMDLYQARQHLIAWRIQYQLEEESLPTPRLQHASRLSVNTFLAMIDYILIGLTDCTAGFDGPINGDLVFILMQGFADLEVDCHKSVAMAKVELQRLRLTDSIAATQTVALLRMMLRRVLGPPEDKNPLQGPLDNLLNNLTSDN